MTGSKRLLCNLQCQSGWELPLCPSQSCSPRQGRASSPPSPTAPRRDGAVLAAEASGPSLSRAEGVLNSWSLELPAGLRAAVPGWAGLGSVRAAPRASPTHQRAPALPRDWGSATSQECFHLDAADNPAKGKGNGLAGGLSNERALGKLCLLHPGILKASRCMHVPFHFPIAVSFVLFIFQNLDGISKGIEQ